MSREVSQGVSDRVPSGGGGKDDAGVRRAGQEGLPSQGKDSLLNGIPNRHVCMLIKVPKIEPKRHVQYVVHFFSI